jgi:SAM-dependent methyltransferase
MPLPLALPAAKPGILRSPFYTLSPAESMTACPPTSSHYEPASPEQRACIAKHVEGRDGLDMAGLQFCQAALHFFRPRLLVISTFIQASDEAFRIPSGAHSRQERALHCCAATACRSRRSAVPTRRRSRPCGPPAYVPGKRIRMVQTSVRDHYQTHSTQEWRRLVKNPFHRLEFDTTVHFLGRHLPPAGRVLDAGGGPGRYTIELARRGYDMVLLDLTPALLEIARRRIARAGVKRRVSAVVEGSIADLSRFPAGHFDAVLCLGGPLSHIATEEERRQAVGELVRVARPGAPVCVSVMGRLAVLSESPRYWPAWIEHTTGFIETWRDGDDHHWYGSSYAHFFLPEELLTLAQACGLEVVETIGLEGLGSHSVEEINRLARRQPAGWRNWLEMHAALCTHPAVFATSQHMLVIGRKREQ